MSRAEQLLNSYKPQTPNIDASGFVNQNQQAMGNYQGRQQEIMNNFKQQGAGYLQNMRQQAQMQMQNLNKQLQMNMAKYDNAQKFQQGNIAKQHKEQAEGIDQRTFEQYKYSNQMGARRGVSNSAQQRAMDNHVGQQSSALFYQNDDQRNQMLNELQYKIMEGKMGLQQQHMSDVNNLQINMMDKEGKYNMQMAEQEMQHAMQLADKMVSQQLQNNEITFKTEKELEMYKVQVAQDLFSKRLQNAQQQDSMDFDWKKMQAGMAHDKEMQDRSFANQQKLESMRQKAIGGDLSNMSPEQQEMYNAWAIENMKRIEMGQAPLPFSAIESWYNEYIQNPWNRQQAKKKASQEALQNAIRLLGQSGSPQDRDIAGAFATSSTKSNGKNFFSGSVFDSKAFDRDEIFKNAIKKRVNK